MTIDKLEAYEVVEHKRIDDLDSDSWLLKHKKTGARVALLSNNDENKVFYIGFRTPPTDSTGVAHIIEHTVLCGSRDFPVKDPFIELAKGSLNTFLNAMTYPDKTVYPVASCNDKDFQNLMHVYLDAVFYPDIYKTDMIFSQEGWHYELKSRDSELGVNGVVYNEMKGAYSSPDDVLDRQIMNSLFPDTTYAIESGGDPDDITKLTYEQYLDFHRRYYHPSNSYIYLYGNMDMVEKLKYIDENYLCAFDRQQTDSEIKCQEPFNETKEIHKQYSIMKEETEQQNTYLTYNCCVGSSLDRELYIAFSVLDYALCSAPGAALRKALIDKGIGRDVYSEYENGIKQPFFSIISKNADATQKQAFIDTIQECLGELVKNGINKKTLLAGINYEEFKYREADYGRFPKGLLFGLQVLDSWLYDDNSPWINVEAGETFKKLREMVQTDYYEQLVNKYLLNNTHSTILLLEPVKGLSEKKDAKLKKDLAAYKDSLSDKQIEAIVKYTGDLKKYQETPDSPEALKCVPLLTRYDIEKKAQELHNELRTAGDTKVLFHNIFTNGIGYVTLVFNLENVPEDLFQYIGLYKTVLGLVDTKKHSYSDLNDEINIYTGGISAAVNTYSDNEYYEKYKTVLEISVKVLDDKMDKAFDLIAEILMQSEFDDSARIREILNEQKSHMQSAITSGGHQAAAVRALSYMSETAAINDMMNGIGASRLVEKLCSDYSEDVHSDLAEKFELLSKIIFRKENLLADYTADEKSYAHFEDLLGKLVSGLNTGKVRTGHFDPKLIQKNEAFMTSGQVQYVACAGNFRQKGLKYTGALQVLKVMMGYDYLWNNIRVKGGAYGCMSGFARNGDAYFVTYRDPHLKRSVSIFRRAGEYLRSYSADERKITQFIIGAVGELDTPKNPNAKGAYGLSAYMSGVSIQEIQRNRDELLAVDDAVIRSLSDYLEAVTVDNNVCAIGTSEKIHSDSVLFLHIEQLFRNF